MKLSHRELFHHGIKGQKWGVRRYQNSDGTWTEEGKARRREGDGSLSTEAYSKLSMEKRFEKAQKIGEKTLAEYEKLTRKYEADCNNAIKKGANYGDEELIRLEDKYIEDANKMLNGLYDAGYEWATYGGGTNGLLSIQFARDLADTEHSSVGERWVDDFLITTNDRKVRDSDTQLSYDEWRKYEADAKNRKTEIPANLTPISKKEYSKLSVKERFEMAEEVGRKYVEEIQSMYDKWAPRRAELAEKANEAQKKGDRETAEKYWDDIHNLLYDSFGGIRKNVKEPLAALGYDMYDWNFRKNGDVEMTVTRALSKPETTKLGERWYDSFILVGNNKGILNGNDNTGSNDSARRKSYKQLEKAGYFD